jgi:hypothetical protein
MEGAVSVRSSLDVKLKRMTAIEAEYRHALRRAEEDLRRDPERRKRYLRIIEKNKKRIEKILPKIRRARERRSDAK